MWGTEDGGRHFKYPEAWDAKEWKSRLLRSHGTEVMHFNTVSLIIANGTKVEALKDMKTKKKKQRKVPCLEVELWLCRVHLPPPWNVTCSHQGVSSQFCSFKVDMMTKNILLTIHLWRNRAWGISCNTDSSTFGKCFYSLWPESPRESASWKFP